VIGPYTKVSFSDRAADRALRSRRDVSPEGERKLDGRLRVLGLEDGNGFQALIIPSRVKSAEEERSGKPNGLEEKLRISSKK
jgi:hypothetical protein